VHHEDFTRAVRWLIDRDDLDGAVNIAAPEPLPNAEFMRVLRARGARRRLPVERLDAGSRRRRDAHRDRADSEEPPRGARALLESGFALPLPRVGRRRA
jgi:hypothetical protein